MRITLPHPIVRCIAASAIALAMTAATAQAADSTLTASGTGDVTPKPSDRKSEKAIAEAVEAAEAQALPRAVSEARNHARALAKAGGFKLGDLVSISDSPSPGYPVYGYFGPFASGRFCNKQPNRKVVVRPDGTRRSVVTKGTHLVCRVPPRVTATVSMTFEIER